MKTLSRVGACVVLAISLFGCNENLFGFMDGPNGDDQLLSSARACLDQGNINCAIAYYNQVSGSKADAVNSEEAFAYLKQGGVGLDVFIGAFGLGTGSVGPMINKLAAAQISRAGLAQRLLILKAYLKTLSIVDTKTQALVRLVTSMTLMSEILAEDATSTAATQILQSNYVSNPTSCKAATSCTTLTTVCAAPAGAKISDTGTQIHLSTDGAASVTAAYGTTFPNLYMLDAAIQEVSAGAAPLGLGSVSSASGSFVISLAPNCYRQSIINYGIGN